MVPERIADQLALCGDKVDNIPGVPEVGPKTAARLLRKYDTLENLCRHLHEVGDMKFRYAARVQRSLLDHQAMLDTYLRLTRINCDIDAMKDVEITRRKADPDRLADMMQAQDMGDARRRRWLDYLSSHGSTG